MEKTTLIIHPKDSSTHFLDIVYKPIPNKTIITGNVSKEQLRELIKAHDRIMMMGHGSPSGLFSVGQFPNSGAYIIDDSMADILKEKEDSVFIWCHANKYVDYHDLKGFYSGMFISEVGESYYCGLRGVTQDIVDESNYGFCHILAECITENSDVIHENVMSKYGVIAEGNRVATYNLERLFLNN